MLFIHKDGASGWKSSLGLVMHNCFPGTWGRIAARMFFFVCLFICFVFSCFIVCLFTFVFQDEISLCSRDCPGTPSIDQAGLERRDPPASASQMLALKVYATTLQQIAASLRPV